MRAKGSLQKFFFKNVTNVTWGGLLGQNVTFLKLSFKSISSHSESILLIFFLEGFPKVIVTTVFVYGAANVVKFRPRMNRKVGVKLCAILTTLIWNVVFLVSSFTLEPYLNECSDDVADVRRKKFGILQVTNSNPDWEYCWLIGHKEFQFLVMLSISNIYLFKTMWNLF